MIPNGLKIELEPSIGNHNEEFLTKWNDKLDKFSKELTQDVIVFCGKTITDTTIDIEETNRKLKDIANQEQETEITTTLQKNQDTRKHNLKRNKDKKYYNPKYRNTKRAPRPQGSWPGPHDEDTPFQQSENNTNNFNTQTNQDNHRTYANITRRDRSNTNLPRKPNFNRSSNTNLSANNLQNRGPKPENQETIRLRQRVKELEQRVNQTHTPEATTSTSTNMNNQPKNMNSAQSNGPGAPLQIHDMLEYITNTMQTLNNLKTQLTQLRDTGPTHSGTS